MFELQAAIAAKIGFATHQNAVPVIRELSVTAPADQAGQKLSVLLTADPPFLQQKTWRIEAIAAGDTLRILDRNIGLNATLLHDLAESLVGKVTLTLQDEEGATLAERVEPIELLALNHWGGLPMAELLAAFVMPNDPAVDRILKAASDTLRGAGRPDGIDGYKSGERRRVWELTSAIWAAIAGLRLSYALPPASFERLGQKIRSPSQIHDGRVATCLDTTLLFAAALEQANLNPIVVLTQGHAFAGVWLQPVEFATVGTDEAAALRRRIDLDEMVLFETTLVTADPPASFSQAIAHAQRQIAEDADGSFQMAIDLRRARLQKIRPLGLSTAGAASGAEAPVLAESLEAAPALPAFDVEVTETAATGAAGRILQWQRKLLNLTTSNSLLNLRDSKSVVKLLCPDPAALEDLLSGGKRVRIVPMPDLTAGGRDEKLFEQQTQTRLRDELAEQAMQRGEALSLLAKDQLDAALVGLYRKARTDLEEGGANTLYLALGFLKWKKSAAEEKSYRAPLILLPVQLERKSVLSGMAMIAHEDEARFNLTLLELLRQDFELTIPGLDGDLPKDQSGIDVAGVWRMIRTAVRDISGFEVVPDVVLGTFSFAKYLMWRDLVDRADKLKDSPLVRHLIEGDGAVELDRGGFPHPREIDRKVDPASLFTPLPGDSSQLAAIVASAEGRHFVLDGPPGTGKSQTIANMIAHNLGLGRRVLFVAEKRAALEVVQRRLADKGLGPFCLELHSAKATKSAVLRQLDSAWTASDALSAEAWEREAAEMRRLRDDLNAIVALLHRPEPNGWTIHRAIGRAISDTSAVTPKLLFAASARHSGEEMAAFRDVARRLGIARKAVADLPADLDGIARTEWSNEWQEGIVASAGELPETIAAVEEAGARLTTAMGLSFTRDSGQDFIRLLTFAELCLSLHGQDWRFAFASDTADRIAAARSALALIARYKAEEAALSAAYAPEAARRIDIDGTRAAWAEASAKFALFAGGAKRKVAQALAQSGGAAGTVDPEADLPRLSAMRALLAEIDALVPQGQTLPGWAGLATDPARIAATVEKAERLRAAIAAEADGAEALAALRRVTAGLVVEANELLASEGPVALATRALRRALDQLETATARFAALAAAPADSSLATLRASAQAAFRHGRRLRDWTAWRRARADAAGAGLGPLVEALERGAVAPEAAVLAFESAYARWFAFTRIDQEPLLRDFMVGEHEDRIVRFRALDDRLSELSSRYIRAKLCGMIPDKNAISKKDGYGVLKYQLQLQRPSKPIRQLAAEMGDAFNRLAPCMLMSPLSIAQYLPADQALFDLVIFDEASQITPWDAIGAMARGKQVVIAGDPRQMPPSNDFTRSASTEAADDDTLPDLPSILDECLAAGVPRHSLDWHYRSRHESLICFSNTRYYESRLVTFPAPETRPSAVSWRRVPGVYTAGARINPIEAQALVDEAVRRLRDPAFVDERGRPLSLGIITMNAEQMRLVEDLLDKARRAHPAIEEHFDGENRLEPVCVRNLETVQGDERDVILIGVNFGPTEPGGRTMSMAFGKLNASGGWRRLNVATTRARREMMVFTSFEPGMIDLTRTAAEGVRDLKAFIEFADRGPRALAEANRGSLGGADSPFEEAVAAALRSRGWTVAPQVGVSKYRIDLGVVHPDRPGDFLLGVECDGAAYHSAATARDRDKVRAAILEGLGWSLLRIWSTDWWIDKERAAERLHGQIEAALAADRAAAPAEPAQLVTSEAEPPPLPGGEGRQPDLQPVISDESMAVVSALAETQEVYARIVEPAVLRSDDDGLYRAADLTTFSGSLDPVAFYEPGYDGVLVNLIGEILAREAPIAETVLVQRIARAHGFQRAGRLIRDRVIGLLERLHFVEQEPSGGRFVWLASADRAVWSRARAPADPDSVRQIEEICLAELAVASRGRDLTEIARLFGVRRISASARARIEEAQRSGWH